MLWLTIRRTSLRAPCLTCSPRKRGNQTLDLSATCPRKRKQMNATRPIAQISPFFQPVLNFGNSKRTNLTAINAKRNHNPIRTNRWGVDKSGECKTRTEKKGTSGGEGTTRFSHSISLAKIAKAIIVAGSQGVRQRFPFRASLPQPTRQPKKARK